MSVVHPRMPPRTQTPRAGAWWGKAWARAVEESAYAEADLRRGRSLARAGAVGAIEVHPGGYVAAVEERGDAFTVSGSVEPLGPDDQQLLVEVVAGGAGRIASLLSGELPHVLVEDLEEVGVEPLPYAGELGSTCTCEAWVDPCPHALAVLTQLGWLLAGDPMVLLHLRGLERDELLARVHESAGGGGEEPDDEDLEAGLDAALRAARLLAELDAPPA